MFEVGDKVVYPIHGAGVIEAIEQREVLGESRSYYILHLPLGSMRVMVPTDSEASLGIRPVIDRSTSEQVLAFLSEEKADSEDKWNKRYRVNLDKLRSGDIFEVADVVRSLSHRDITKGLSGNERKLLGQARDILASELILAREAKLEQVLAQLDDILLK